MAVTIRTANLPAERMPHGARVRALDTVLDGADIVDWQEIEVLVPDILARRRGRHIIHGNISELAKRPMTYDPKRVRFLDAITHPAHLLDPRWPKGIPSFRGWQTGARFLSPTGREFTVFNVHLIHKHGLGARRRAYARTIAALVDLARRETGPVIIGGDWNATPGSRKLAPLRAAGFRPVAPGPTHGGRRRKPIDFFMVRDVTVLGARVMPRPAGGDHNPVTATFDL